MEFHSQVGLIVTNRVPGVGRNVTVTIGPQQNQPDRIPDVTLSGSSITGHKSLQFQILQVGVSQCLNGGWTNDQGTTYSGVGLDVAHKYYFQTSCPGQVAALFLLLSL